jgi:2-oxoisovalerate dehydrogenase E1 component alpha subunit
MYHSAKANLFSISGNLATQFPQAVGWAMAAAIKGEDHIAATWTGEGSTAEADFHHALLFASVYRAPVILNVVNNQWAISTFQGTAGGEQSSFAAAGSAYGPSIARRRQRFPGGLCRDALGCDRARTGGGATVIGHPTRGGIRPATSGPLPAARRIPEWPLGDPVERLKQHLIALGEWSEERHRTLTGELEAQVVASWKEALSYGTMNEGPRLDRDLMFEDVFKEIPEHLRRQRELLRAEIAADPKAS